MLKGTSDAFWFDEKALFIEFCLFLKQVQDHIIFRI